MFLWPGAYEQGPIRFYATVARLQRQLVSGHSKEEPERAALEPSFRNSLNGRAYEPIRSRIPTTPSQPRALASHPGRAHLLPFHRAILTEQPAHVLALYVRES